MHGVSSRSSQRNTALSPTPVCVYLPMHTKRGIYPAKVRINQQSCRFNQENYDLTNPNLRFTQQERGFNQR